MNCETRELTRKESEPSATQSPSALANKDEEQLRKKIASKISEIYNISYDELYKTIMSNESTDQAVHKVDTSMSVVASKPATTAVVSDDTSVSVDSKPVMTLDAFKREHMRKTLKDLKDMASSHNVSIHGTKEKLIEKIYAAIYSDTTSRKSKKAVAMINTNPIIESPGISASASSSTIRKSNEHILEKYISQQDTVQTRDIGVDTSDLSDLVCDSEQLWFNIQRNMLSGYNMHSHTSKVSNSNTSENSANGVFSKWGDILTRDFLLLLQTHKLSTAGTRDDWIARLKEFYKQIPPSSSSSRPIEWNEEEINQLNEDMISRIDARPSFMKCIASAVPVTIYTDSNGVKRADHSVPCKKVVVDRESRYVWVKERNWVFIEDSSSYEFIGCIIDSVLISCDIPNELLQMNE
jgi:hypothetical protein